MKIGEKVKQWKQVAGGPILRNFLSTTGCPFADHAQFLEKKDSCIIYGSYWQSIWIIGSDPVKKTSQLILNSATVFAFIHFKYIKSLIFFISFITWVEPEFLVAHINKRHPEAQRPVKRHLHALRFESSDACVCYASRLGACYVRDLSSGQNKLRKVEKRES